MAASTIAWKMSGIAPSRIPFSPRRESTPWLRIGIVAPRPPCASAHRRPLRASAARRSSGSPLGGELDEPAHAAAPFFAPGHDLVELGLRQILADDGAALLDDVHRYLVRLFFQL